MTENQKTGQGGRKPWWVKRKQGAKPVVAPPKPKGNYAFIDSQNLNLGVQKIGWKMDWHKFREWLKSEYNVEQAFMFIGYMPDNESLYEQMYAHGFLVVLKPTVDIKPTQQVKAVEDSSTLSGVSKPSKPGENMGKKTEETEKSQVKGNIDADLVLYAMKELPNYDKAVIVSGDGDFFSLIEYLRDEKKLLKVLAPNRRFSTLLQGFDEYIEGIDQHRRELAYRDFRHKKPNTRTR
ncbi:NYN domain-containing protein [Candidatus Saccharibacteria bacterium]|nr:MAG: NYN domain-containing protein [Candidatus Saccharibacteria bacterium]